jgi:hypothetical protein
MTGEAIELSPRVKRRLPVSTLGRAFLTWFNPGPGTGYLFAISNVIVTAILAIASAWYAEGSAGATIAGFPTAAQLTVGVLVLLAYLIIYLGVGNLLLRLLRKFTQINLAAAVLVNALLVLAGWGVPAIIDPYNFGTGIYNLGHITDPFWTCAATFSTRSPILSEQLLWIVLPTAAAVFLFNLMYIVPEIRQHRIAPPQRVAEEDRALTTVVSPTPSQPASPWD